MLNLSFLSVRFACSLVLALASLSAAEKADRVVLLRSKHLLTLYQGAKVLKSYKVALGDTSGPKRRQGDRKTPEGIYRIAGRNAQSQYHRSLRISYPSADDRKRAARLNAPPGGDIMIHGLPNGYHKIGAAHRLRDWTDGCIAVTDEEIEEIWSLVPDGARVELLP